MCPPGTGEGFLEVGDTHPHPCPGDGEKQTWVYRQATWGRPGPAVACVAQSRPLSPGGSIHGAQMVGTAIGAGAQKEQVGPDTEPAPQLLPPPSSLLPSPSSVLHSR